ncbi:MAG: hypothetical protein ACQEUY_04780 [Pseudomonadota bacterium]
MSTIERYVESAFAPIKEKCEQRVNASYDKLQVLPPEDKRKQFRLFKSFRLNTSSVLQLRTGDFLFFFSCDDKEYVAVSVDHFDHSSLDELLELMEGLECSEEIFEHAFFMRMCHDLKGVYYLSKHVTTNEIENQLGLGKREISKDYYGHSADELIDLYSKVKFFGISRNSPISFGEKKWKLAAKVILECRSLRPFFISDEIVESARYLYEIGNVKHENIYLSLSASHWKYTFLEIYRSLEALYYLPWMNLLRERIGVDAGAITLVKCVEEIGWKKNEEQSIKKMIKEIPFSIIEEARLSDLQSFNDVSIEDTDASRSAIASNIYKIRNQSVHHEDYREREVVEMSAECWNRLCVFVYRVCGHYYSNFVSDIKAYNQEL